MKIFDAHCDVLFKLWMNKKYRRPDRIMTFEYDSDLHVTRQGLQAGDSHIQCFAVYIPEIVPHEQRFFAALEMIQIFYEDILEKSPDMKLILSKNDADMLEEGEIGALLTLEGCDAIGQSLTKLKTLYRLGVRSVGLTWNYGNAVADGILEKRGSGLSSFGEQIVKQLNTYKLWTDVSHISEKGFWDVMEQANHPIASHSNVFSLCPHPRNLKDDQIKALIERNGIIGVTYVPMFLNETGKAEIADIIRHIDYICSMGGEKHIGFGSDFDGIDHPVENFTAFAQYEHFINELLKHYSEEQVKSFAYRNFIDKISF
ncbi:dipeptidase [Bacillus sp. 165]|uniref:dipeptidase n=1 Tax=Bacillus sp. 165 TaxID=1529117 RepID=UPI001ADBB4A2|nr:dipeptidase [Bacillus sp. 165]MBO9128899.1 dipeptidase [Bacillus sp. 165]